MGSYTPQQFVAAWRSTALGERQSYQLHFLDVCRLIASCDNPAEKERLNRLVHRGLVNAVVYGQGGTNYFLTHLGESALNGDARKEANQ